MRHFREHVNDYRRCSMLLDHFQSTLIAGDGDGGGGRGFIIGRGVEVMKRGGDVVLGEGWR